MIVRNEAEHLQPAVRGELERLTGLGYGVFPIVRKAKRPLTKNGVKDATTDMAQVDAWLRQHGDCNWAVAVPEGVIVLDIDTTDGGEANPWPRDPEQAADLADCGALANTPRKGRHYWYRKPAGRAWGNTSGKLAPKVDTRGPGGYVLVYPSSTRDGEYSWVPGMTLETPPDALPEPPGWLVEKLDANPVRHKATTGEAGTIPPAECKVVYDKSTELFVNTKPCWHGKALQALDAAGGQVAKTDANGTVYITRPGRDVRDGYSAKWNHPAARHGANKSSGERYGYPRLTVFSGNWPPFEAEQSYSAYDILRLLTPDQKEWQLLRGQMEFDHGNFWQAAEPENFYNPEDFADMSADDSEEVPAGAGDDDGYHTDDDAGVDGATIPGFSNLWEVKVNQGEFCVPGLFVPGLNMVSADPGQGKSTFMRQITADIAGGRGRYSRPDGPAAVAWLLTEDDPGAIVLPELVGMGLTEDDVRNRVLYLDHLPTTGAKFNACPEAYALVEQAMKGRPDLRLMVIDPNQAFLSNGGLNSASPDDVRRGLDPLHHLGQKYNVAVVVLGHLRKDQNVEGQHRSSGSHQVTATARVVYLGDRDGDTTHFRLVKWNQLGGLPCLAFRRVPLEGAELQRAIDVFGERWDPEWNTDILGRLEWIEAQHGNDSSGPTPAERIAGARIVIMGHLQMQAEWVSLTALGAYCTGQDISVRNRKEALAALEAEEAIDVRTRRGGKGSKWVATAEHAKAWGPPPAEGKDDPGEVPF